MKLDDLTIGTRLRLGLGAILALVVGLGAMAWIHSDDLWLQTKTLYDHPHQVRRAIGGLEADVLVMHRGMKDLALATNEREIAASLQSVEAYKADAARRLGVLYDRYLGPRADIKSLEDELAKWNAIRDETTRLLRSGNTGQATARIRSGGVDDAQARILLGQMAKVDDFARAKGDRIYREAAEMHQTLNRRLVGIVALILLLALVVSWLLLKGIQNPLWRMASAAERFRQGDMDARGGYQAANELGSLSAAFDAMADTVQARMRLDEQAAHLVGIMLRESEVHAFCRELLKGLIGYTGSQIGAVYLLNARGTEFEHFESVGLGEGGRASFSAAAAEGEFGAALATGRMQRITDIPDDTRFAFATVSGEFKPREIITCPLLEGDKAVAVVSLAGIRAYSDSAVRLVEEIQDTLTARMNGVLAFRRIQEMSQRLERSNQELSTQQRELVAQSGELTAQSKELTQQNTELQMQKRQLDEASRLKSAFLSNMSHELRTPLNSVIALSGVLGRRLAKAAIPEEEYAYLEVIERNGKHLLALINDILDLSRIEAGREEISLGQFSLRSLTDEIVAMLDPLAQDKNIALANLVKDDLPPITTDLHKCRHILQNLVANAVKFTEAGSVEISAFMEGEDLLVSVRDSGIGIAADQLPHIFEEFRQADDSASRKYGGTGLGLAIAKRYAALLRGVLTVQSAPGHGSTFTLRLPRTLSPQDVGTGAVALLEDRPRPAGVRNDAASGQGRRILLVEDNEPAVIQMCDILTNQGYGVQVARDGAQALAHVALSLPDAVILDLMMPEMDGFEVLGKMRAVERTASLPVLILTAKHVNKAELTSLKGNHIHQLIQKGDINKAELLAAIADMVASTQAKAPPAEPQPTRPPRQGKPVILVVEDNADNLRTMRALLGDEYAVLEAMDGRAGVELAREHRPDLILMDLALPVMDGYAALAEIRKDPGLRCIPVLAVTASAMKGDREQVLAHGFDGYISKPLDERLLAKAIRESLS